MTAKTSFLLLTVVQLLTSGVLSQDCIDFGRRCGDHSQCCGGCCIEGVCTETYRLCHDLTNPCREHYCPPGMECTLFAPENCPGCDVQGICK